MHAVLPTSVLDVSGAQLCAQDTSGEVFHIVKAALWATDGVLGIYQHSWRHK